jgi:hypothetical protein
VAAVSRAGRSPAEIAGSKPARAWMSLSLFSVVCCQVEVPATGRSLVHRSPTEGGVCVIEREREREREIECDQVQQNSLHLQ